MEGQTLQTNNQRPTPLGHRVSAYQKLAPRHWSEPFCIVLSVLKDWGLQYQGMKLVHVLFSPKLHLTLFWSVLAEFFSNDFHSCISWKRHHWPGSQDRLSTVNSGSLVHQASAVTWQEWQAGDHLIWISRCQETCPNLLIFLLVGWGKSHENNLERTVPVEWSFLVAQAWNSVMGSYQPAAGRGWLVRAEWVRALCEEGEDKALVKWRSGDGRFPEELKCLMMQM